MTADLGHDSLQSIIALQIGSVVFGINGVSSGDDLREAWPPSELSASFGIAKYT